MCPCLATGLDVRFVLSPDDLHNDRNVEKLDLRGEIPEKVAMKATATINWWPVGNFC